jgi:hypothetical protein
MRDVALDAPNAWSSNIIVDVMPDSNRKSYYEDTSADHSRAIQLLLGRQLRTMYDSLVREDLPDQFAELLRELDRRGHEGER